MDYYKQLIEDIENSISENRKDDALKIIDDELNMPFIPKDVHEKLLYYKDLLRADDSLNKTLNDETLEVYLFDTKEHQLLAADHLNKVNLRNYIELVDRYLKSDGFVNAKMLLIDSLIDQQIDYEFSVKKDAKLVNFNPSKLYKVYETEEFSYAVKLIENEYMKEPSRLLLAKKVLLETCMMSYPIMYSKQSIEEEVKEIVKTINEAFDSAI